MQQDDKLLWQIILQVVLIIVNAFFSASEITLLSFNEAKAEKKAEGGSKKAARLLALKRTPEKFLATIQVGITLAGFLASAFAANNFADGLTKFFISLNTGITFKTFKTISVVLITLVLSFFTIIFGELVPKRVAMKNADALSYIFASSIEFFSKIFGPLVWLLSELTNRILRILRIDPTDENQVTEEEIRLMVDSGSAKGTIEESEKEIINNVFEFDDRSAGELMTHRLETAILWLRDNDDSWKKTIIEKKHNYYPVCGETIDDIKGVLCTRDFLLLENHSRKTVLAKAVHPAHFVPESLKADVIFKKMKQNRNHFVIVVDEYGGFSGICTMNAILASIMGKF
jgi:putative hemolysin